MNNGAIIQRNRGDLVWPEGGGVNLGNYAFFEMNSGQIIYNYADSGAGVRQSALDPVGSTFIMRDGIIAHNVSTTVDRDVDFSYGTGGGDAGGVLVQRNCTFIMEGGKIHDNTANFRGGAVVVRGANSIFQIDSGEITNNHIIGTHQTDHLDSVRDGGGVWMDDGATFIMKGGAITDNTTPENGGGVFAQTATITMDGGRITANKALKGDGGGVFIGNNSDFNLSGTATKDIADNQGKYEGGIWVAETAAMEMLPYTTNVNISNNTATQDGGGIFTQRSQYYSVLTPGYGVYDNLIITQDMIFSGNQAANWFSPPFVTLGVNNQLPNILWNPVTGSSILHDQEYLYPLNNYDINFQGEFTTLTISKEVTGDLGNRMMDFQFTITLEDSMGNPLPAGVEFEYVGDTIPDLIATAPLNNRLILDNKGSATFTLSHGQAIGIQDVPLDAFVRIVETPSEIYQTGFVDSGMVNPGDSNASDTGSRPMTVDRVFSFVNHRTEVPPTGMDSKNTRALLLLFTAISIPTMTTFTLSRIYRHKKVR
jgi:predicted outer membrane repeat protein